MIGLWHRCCALRTFCNTIHILLFALDSDSPHGRLSYVPVFAARVDGNLGTH
jgi:hypothetical protein